MYAEVETGQMHRPTAASESPDAWLLPGQWELQGSVQRASVVGRAVRDVLPHARPADAAGHGVQIRKREQGWLQ